MCLFLYQVPIKVINSIEVKFNCIYIVPFNKEHCHKAALQISAWRNRFRFIPNGEVRVDGSKEKLPGTA